MKLNNLSGRLLAVGDVHGCLRPLETLMDQVAPGPRDQVVFLGDYIDRGPDSAGVVDYLCDFGRRFPATVFLKGNHEAMFLDFLAGRDRYSFLANGGQATLDSYEQRGLEIIPAEHLRFFNNLRLYYEIPDFIFVHAGLLPGLPPNRQSEEDLLWIRNQFLSSGYSWNKTVVFGHTPQDNGPLVQPGRLGLDTGAVYGRTLTCCEVRTHRFWSVPAGEPKRKRFFLF
ncbi:metallophosphoesterase family protein [Geoalkalibacter halelectricus]|nr:metallophosphoesterase family protein [Geoalkalibacter halelectricus]MDO3378953.1 serine/threonine protein phosphatase [Geoalkalibacter halelectricus]